MCDKIDSCLVILEISLAQSFSQKLFKVNIGIGQN
jgi:hypothetical protein